MSFQQGLSGLNAAAKNLDIIGNNVSNSNTIGYKGSAAQFSDVYANSLAGAGGTSVGIGTSLTSVQQTFGQGNINSTNNPLDIAINGNGFFRMSNNGAISYARNGQFQLDKSGYVVNPSGEHLTGYSANTSGTISTASATDLQLSSADLSPQATATSTVLVNLDGRSTTLTATAFDPTDTTTYHNATSMSVYDSLGNSHTLSMYFVKSAANTWQVFAAQDGTQIGAANVAYASGKAPVGTVNFLPSGAIDTATTTMPMNLSGAITTGATSPLAYTLDLTGSTQFGSAFGVNQLDQNGFASGRLSGFATGADGVILGRYSNGQSRALGQIVLANFTNPNGLQPMGSNNWTETPTSGSPLVGAPSTGSLGVLQSGALEDSNIDLTAELVNMITAQRVYQANAQTIKTQDSVLQTLVNLR
jgi:flagellar hook protein FlgE